jgi:SAM-dependent methyltransferase
MRPTLVRTAPCAEVEAYLRERRREGRPAVFDLGCGAHKTERAFGIDSVRLPGVDLVHDLTKRPYPLPDDCADEVVLYHVLEHFVDPLPLLEEVWRITRPGGRVLVRTPHYSGRYAWKDPTHHRTFTSESFDYFGENDYSYYTHARFAVVHVRLKYFMEEELWPRPHRAWGRLVQWLLESHPTFAERFLCYVLGGIEELQVTLEALKPQPRTETAKPTPAWIGDDRSRPSSDESRGEDSVVPV